MSEAEGFGGGGRGGGPNSTRGGKAPRRRRFQGGRGAGPATAPTAWPRKSHPRCVNSSNPYHECVDYCFQRIGGNRVGKAHPDCVFAAYISHKCDKICAKRRAKQSMARVREEIEMKGGNRLHPKCINASNPYHECVSFCFKKIMDQNGKDSATEQNSQSPKTTAATKEPSSSVKSTPTITFANTTVSAEDSNMQANKIEAAQSATSILEDVKPLISRTVANEMGESNQDMLVQTQVAPTSPLEHPPTQMVEDIKPKLSEGATKPFVVPTLQEDTPSISCQTEQAHEKALAAPQMVQSTGLIELEGLEEEVKKHREARELRKRRKIEASYPCNGEDNIEDVEYRLALKLLEYERLGYLTKVENLDDDESLVQHGDIFGLAVLNEYPKFFIQVPQHPHYREASLNKVKRGLAENFWDLLMPLIQRGISAVRENKEMEIAAVEQMITRLTEEGFNLKHLQAYINTSRRARANRSSLKNDLEKVKSEIEIEEREINHVLSCQPLSEVIKELEANKAMCQNFMNKVLSEIDASLVKTLNLLNKERVIRETKTTPVHTALLDLKGHLETGVREANGEVWTLLLE